LSDRLQQPLMSDGALLIDVDARLECLVSPWVALEPALALTGVQPAARLYLHEAPLLDVEVPRTTPTLRVGSVGVWLRQDAGRAVLGAAEQDCAGAVDLEVMQATVVTSVTSGVRPRLHAMLTLAVSLLLGRLGRALVSAGAVVAPGGGAWLLVGDEGGGAATALRRLVASGWSYLSAERALLRQQDEHGCVEVEAWPEMPAAESADELAPRRCSAPLAGLLLLRQTPQEETVLAPRAEGDLLAALSPTSPWLRLDQAGAAGILRALRFGLEAPVYDLHLGLDTYANSARLADVLAGLPASH
jgi:hypothetical protein